MRYTTLHTVYRTMALGLCLLAYTHTGHAAPMAFSTTPAGSTAREPAPNIIISVDDSGSMGWDVNGCVTPDWNAAVYNWRNDSAAIGGACPAASAAAAGANPNPSRRVLLQQALFNTFGNASLGTTGLVPDGRIRLAWQAMWDNGAGLRPAGQTGAQNTLTPGNLNTIRSFAGAHRNNFTNFVNSLRPLWGTPSHLMLNNVTAYMGTAGVNSPFAQVPGITRAPELSCRRSYHIFMTDGGWNTEAGTVGNADGTNRTLGDGTTTYNIASNQTQAYRDLFGGVSGPSGTGTLADIAFYNWATDFRSDLTNDLRPLYRVTTTVTIGATPLQPFWNPRNNPMTWQGVTQYTIGFGNPATSWAGNPVWDTATDDTYGGGYSGLVNGSVTWQNLMPSVAAAVAARPMDLWHAALNGRGTYTPARTAASLTNAFQTILNDILSQTANPLVSVATSSSRLSAGGLAYVAGYDSQAQWSGSLAAFPINTSTSLPANSPTWRAETHLNDTATFSLNNRVVLTHNGNGGRSFVWDNLSSSQKAAIQGSDSVATGTARIAYLRGDRTLEGSTMRTRSSRLGDIVNSNLWYTGKPTRMPIDLPGHSAFRSTYANRTPTVYVGANDGMLHGFNATPTAGVGGKELIAYVPSGLYGNTTTSPLRDLTRPAYTHRYFVDGHPFSGDVKVGAGIAATDWKTLLVGTLGAGGKGYFVLDVTDPTANFVNPAGTATMVLLDTTANTGTETGHIFAAPVVDELTRSRSEQIVRVNDTAASGRWAAIMGNGYNSTSEMPVLLVQYLDGLRELKTIAATTANGASTAPNNGLGAPRPIDLNGDGRVDIVYAGDLKGNLWKFDLRDPNPNNWKVGFGGEPLFTARDGGGNPQPITTAPQWAYSPNPPRGTLQVLFATGKNLTTADASSTQAQTVYSIWDKTQYTPATTGAAGTDTERITATRTTALVQQSQTAVLGGGYFSTSTGTVAYLPATPTSKRGWFLDLPVSGERVLNHPMHLEGELVLVPSTVPANSVVGETCDLSTATGVSYLNVFNIHSGKPPSYEVFGAGHGNRVLFGSGDYGMLRSPKDNKWTFFTPEATCNGPNCPPPPPPPPPGGRCAGGLRGFALELCNAGLGGVRADWREIR